MTRLRRPLLIAAELVLTAGALVLLFVTWQLWWNDGITGAGQTSAAHALTDDWGHDSVSAPRTDPGEPQVDAEPEEGAVIGVLHVPRWGEDYARTIAEGTGTDVLNSTRLGIGHYDGTQMPGAVGNFAVAAHRSAYGGAFHLVDELEKGDPVIVETPAGWYVYRITSVEIRDPSAVGVLEPVPDQPGVAATERTITLTTCHPLYSTAQRLVAHGTYDTWYPREQGKPAALLAGK